MTTRHVLFLGDSHVAGVGDPSARGWVGRIAAASERVGPPIKVINRGLSGETAHQILWRWQHEAENYLGGERDCRLVASFGPNDALRNGPPARRRVPKLLSHFLDELIEAQLPVFIVGPAPIADPASAAHLAEISLRCGAACAERGVPYAAVFDALTESAVWQEELADGDGAHPGAAGYELLAALITEQGLLDWLREDAVEPQGFPHRRFVSRRSIPGPLAGDGRQAG